jgi:Sec-independent protein translocase protein TatA
LDTLAILIVILLIVLIVRGPKTLPQIGAMLGRGVREARHEAEKLRSSDAPEDGTPKPG